MADDHRIWHEAQAVKDIAAGEMSFTMFMDRKELAKGGAQMAIDYLTGEKVDVKDYSQYDNGVKIVGTFYMVEHR